MTVLTCKQVEDAAHYEAELRALAHREQRVGVKAMLYASANLLREVAGRNDDDGAGEVEVKA